MATAVAPSAGIQTFWIVPAHLEKMLGDDAQLARVSSRVWQVMGSEFLGHKGRDHVGFWERAFTSQTPVADPDGLRALLGRQETGSGASDEL